MEALTKQKMLKALKRLDEVLSQSLILIIGGGGAMVLAHRFPLSTMDLDAMPKGMELAELDELVKQIAKEQNLPPDWLNPYYSTFAHVLPSDYGKRLITVYDGKSLKASALGKEEMLIMKCFAHRSKDVGHAKALIKGGADVTFVEKRIEELLQKRISGAREALDFLDDILDQT